MKKILRVFKDLVFLPGNQVKHISSIHDLSKILEFEALRALITFNHAHDPYTTGRVDIDWKDAKQCILGAIWNVERYIRSGDGFTPRLSLWGNKLIGANCLGRAIILGSLLKHPHYGDHRVHLGITPDHALIVIEEKGELYMCCDNNPVKLKKLNGTITDHGGYRWYTRSDKDNFKFQHIVIQDFDRGILNAISESFLFLQNSKREDVLGVLSFNECKYKVRTRIRTFNWKYFQKKYFSDLNGYRETYKKEHLLDCMYTEQWRWKQRLRRKSDEAIIRAYEKTLHMVYSPEKHKDFITAYVPLLQTVEQKLFTFLKEDTIAVSLSLPKQLMKYLTVLKKAVQKDEDTKQFLIGRFETLLSVQQRA